MTNKERYINCATQKPIDRTPFFFHFGPWRETVEIWKKEGINNPNAWQEGFGFDDGIICLSWYVNHLFYPGFEYKVVEKEDGNIIYYDSSGQLLKKPKDKSTIPKILKSPVENEIDWERLKKERLDPLATGRFPENWNEIVADINKHDAPV